jgi:hypothetical protein
MTAQPNIEQLLADEHARRQPPKRLPPVAAVTRNFRTLDEDHYRLDVTDYGVCIEVDRLRRDRQELVGELRVRCGLPGARTVDGSLSVADFNLSSSRARQERAKLLAERSNAKDIDWLALLEEFVQRVLWAERTGRPAVDLREVQRPNLQEATLEADGFVVPREHPTILFGDGGTCKSMLALRFAGRLSEKGIRVGYFDWELGAEDHRDRLERLFGADYMPQVFYCRCERPLVYEADRLRRIVRENNIQYSIYDSIAFACDGPPESAEIAGKYFRAVRQIGGGSLHVAHITKGENADKKPFGSTFWHNGARSTWYVQLTTEDIGQSDTLQIGLFHKKSNLGRLRQPVGYGIRFEDDCTLFRRTDVADSPDLAAQLTVRQRMGHMLKRGPRTYEQIAEETESTVETISRYARRYREFLIIDGGKVGLAEIRGLK